MIWKASKIGQICFINEKVRKDIVKQWAGEFHISWIRKKVISFVKLVQA